MQEKTITHGDKFDDNSRHHHGFRRRFLYGKIIELGFDTISQISNATSSEPQYVDFSPFWKAWNILKPTMSTPRRPATSTQSEVWGAIQGFTSSFGDPYTVFFPPAENEDFTDEISGSFGGVGMEMGIQNGNIVIIAPLKGTPADLAGVKAGDVLVGVNGQDATTMTLDQVINIIRGNPGTNVTISVARKASPLRSISPSRARP